MTRRVQPTETMVAGPASGQASAGRPVRPALPNLAVLKVVSSRADATPLDGVGESQAKPDTADERADGNDWLTLPKGIALGMLLAVPFWVVLALWLFW